LIILII
jgi:hypothetical protein